MGAYSSHGFPPWVRLVVHSLSEEMQEVQSVNAFENIQKVSNGSFPANLRLFLESPFDGGNSRNNDRGAGPARTVSGKSDRAFGRALLTSRNSHVFIFAVVVMASGTVRTFRCNRRDVEKVFEAQLEEK